MTVLGDAVIEVRGDLKPFVRDLDKELDRAATVFEKRMQASLKGGLGDTAIGESAGEELGEKVGAGFNRKMKDKVGDKRSPWLVSLASALASALDDGISALPTEVKAGIAGALVLSLPLLSGALASAVSAGLGVGVAGLGVLLATQYESVVARFGVFTTNLRLLLVNAASSFVPAVFKALDAIEMRFKDLAPLFNRIFTQGATFLGPLTQGALDFLDQLLIGINDSLEDARGHVREFAIGLRTLGVALGEVFRILAGTGEEGRQAFRDLVFIISASLIAFAKLIAALTEVYSWMRKIAEVTAFFNPLLGGLVQKSDAVAQSSYMWAKSNQAVESSLTGPIKLTKEQEQELVKLKKALDDASDATYGIVESQIAYERALDDIRDALKENGATLKLNSEEGRRNAEEFLTGLKAVEEGIENQMAMGKLSAQQASDAYRQQIQSLRQLAIEGGITAQEFEVLFGNIITVAQLKLDAGAMGIIDTEAQLSGAVTEAAKLYAELQKIKNFRLPKQGTRPFSEYAEGGIVTHPTFGLIGEAGPEVVVPLTKPQRAAQLLQQSGLAGMLGSNGTNVYVYVGNEQLDARTFRIVEDNNRAMSSSLAFGPRGL